MWLWNSSVLHILWPFFPSNGPLLNKLFLCSWPFKHGKTAKAFYGDYIDWSNLTHTHTHTHTHTLSTIKICVLKDFTKHKEPRSCGWWTMYFLVHFWNKWLNGKQNLKNQGNWTLLFPLIPANPKMMLPYCQIKLGSAFRLIFKNYIMVLYFITKFMNKFSSKLNYIH